MSARTIASRAGTRAAVVVAAVVVGAMLLAGTDAVGLLAQSAPDDQLIDRLVELEQQLPPLPPDQVTISDEQTWGEFPGNYRGAATALSNLSEDARALFVEASEGEGAVATAVADAAQALLVLEEGYDYLARWEDADLAFPLGATDDTGTATGADTLYGLAETGLRILLDATERRLPAFEVLADAEAADTQEQQFLADRVAALQEFSTGTEVRLRRGLSLPTTQVLVPTERFETTAPGVEARARSMQAVCVDRDLYETGDVGEARPLTDALAELADTPPAPDCAEFDNGNEARLIAP